MSRKLSFFIIIAVGSHLAKDVSDKRLETTLYFLTDGSLWNVRIFLCETVTYLNGLIVKLCGSIGPRVTRIINWWRKDGIAEGGNGGMIGFIHHALYIFHESCVFIFLWNRRLWFCGRSRLWLRYGVFWLEILLRRSNRIRRRFMDCGCSILLM